MYTCKNRFCPFCSWRRSRKLSLQGYKILDAIRQKENLRYIFLTLTVQNPKLEDTRLIISHMNKSFQRMSQSLRFKNSIVGFCRILEVHPQEKPRFYAPRIFMLF